MPETLSDREIWEITGQNPLFKPDVREDIEGQIRIIRERLRHAIGIEYVARYSHDILVRLGFVTFIGPHSGEKDNWSPDGMPSHYKMSLTEKGEKFLQEGQSIAA